MRASAQLDRIFIIEPKAVLRAMSLYTTQEPCHYVAKKAILYITPKLLHISITEKLYKLSYNVAGKSYG